MIYEQNDRIIHCHEDLKKENQCSDNMLSAALQKEKI